jgi:hypothetical protein
MTPLYLADLHRIRRLPTVLQSRGFLRRRTASFESVRAMLDSRRKAGLSLRSDHTALNGNRSPSIGR